jgi:hypothetical protein
MVRLLLLAVCVLLVLVPVSCQTSSPGLLSPNDKTFPERKLEFEIQGLVWRTIAYYYHTGIYGEIYDDDSNARLVSGARNIGANYFLVRAFYNGTEEGNLVGDTEEAEKYLKRAIALAHEQDMKIFLSPFIESMEFWPERKWQLSTDEWTNIVVHWAQFAEQNNVELFAPGFEMAIIMDKLESKDWFRDILPRIRAEYSGKVAFAEIPYGEQWDLLDETGVFAGYDAAGITIFPWLDYNGVHDMRSFEDLGTHVEEQAQKLNDVGQKYQINLRFVATLGMDFWHGKEPDPVTRAQGYDVCFDILKQYDVAGVFLHKWAAERDHLGESTAVEDMLKTRWTE